MELQDEVASLAQRINDPWITAHLHFSRSVVYTDHAPETAYANFQAGLPHIRAGGDYYILSLSLIHMGEAALVLGRTREAEEYFSEALSTSLELGNGVCEVLAVSGLAMTACAGGAWREALAHSNRAAERSREVGETSGRAKALFALAEAQHGAGDLVAARKSYGEAIRFSVAAQALPTVIDAWLGLATLDVHDHSLGDALAILLPFIRDHPATRRLTAQRAYDLVSKLREEHDAQMIASGERVAATLAPDAVYKLINAYVEGNTSLASHRALTEPGPEPPQPDQVVGGMYVADTNETLSPREVEVLRLLSAGASNQVIADTLTISLHTAKHHIANILRKLGVASRTEAAVRSQSLVLDDTSA
jgi:ATP/maltotriose-dependent transcriptional regulator MalT